MDKYDPRGQSSLMTQISDHDEGADVKNPQESEIIDAAAEEISEKVIDNAGVAAERTKIPLPLNIIKFEGAIPDPVFLDAPTYFVCPNCNFEGDTKVDRAKGPLFTFLFWMPFCWMCSVCDDWEHTCPQCRIVLGSYNNF